MTFDEWVATKGRDYGGYSQDYMREAWNAATKIEREACAKVCDDRSNRKNDGSYADHSWELVCIANELAADAIRERGNK